MSGLYVASTWNILRKLQSTLQHDYVNSHSHQHPRLHLLYFTQLNIPILLGVKCGFDLHFLVSFRENITGSILDMCLKLRSWECYVGMFKIEQKPVGWPYIAQHYSSVITRKICECPSLTNHNIWLTGCNGCFMAKMWKPHWTNQSLSLNLSGEKKMLILCLQSYEPINSKLLMSTTPVWGLYFVWRK